MSRVSSTTLNSHVMSYVCGHQTENDKTFEKCLTILQTYLPINELEFRYVSWSCMQIHSMIITNCFLVLVLTRLVICKRFIKKWRILITMIQSIGSWLVMGDCSL